MNVEEACVTMTAQELREVPELIRMAGDRMMRNYPHIHDAEKEKVTEVPPHIVDVYVTFHVGVDTKRQSAFTRYMKSLGAYVFYSTRDKQYSRSIMTLSARKALEAF